jgi:hypothetical protein
LFRTEICPLSFHNNNLLKNIIHATHKHDCNHRYSHIVHFSLNIAYLISMSTKPCMCLHFDVIFTKTLFDLPGCQIMEIQTLIMSDTNTCLYFTTMCLPVDVIFMRENNVWFAQLSDDGKCNIYYGWHQHLTLHHHSTILLSQWLNCM